MLDEAIMKRKLTLRLLVLLCTVLLPILLPTEAQAQRKLVPFHCEAPNVTCSPQLYLEEGTGIEIDCSDLQDIGRHFHLFFANNRLIMSFTHEPSLLDEFIALGSVDDTNRQPLDSSKAYLLSPAASNVLQLLRDSIADVDIIPHTGSKLMGLFRAFLKFHDFYSPDKVSSFLHRYKQSLPSQARNDWSVYGYPECIEVGVLSVQEQSQRPLYTVHNGMITLDNITGAFTLANMSGQILAQGFLSPGDSPLSIPAPPGVYVLLAGAHATTLLVLR